MKSLNQTIEELSDSELNQYYTETLKLEESIPMISEDSPLRKLTEEYCLGDSNITNMVFVSYRILFEMVRRFKRG